MRDLDEERAYADRCRQALRRMVAGARENVAVGEDTWGDRYTAERLGFYLKTLARDMGEEGDNPPFFGMITYGATDPAAGEHRSQTYYLGRRHISDAIGRPPMVIDWRAPVSATFYQASAVEPRGIDTRRRFGWSANTLTSFEDEHLRTGTPSSASELVRREIERARVGPMRDIVATIQGAPGTGKTAVGLHRAAYLLYAYRSRLERNGVLVLGPNRAFLHYISAVLPTLGEVDVEQTTIEQLLDREVRAVDDPAAAVVKHDVRMAEVLRRAVYGRIGQPDEAVVVRDASYKWRVNQHEFAEMVVEAEAEAMTYLTGRERVIARLVAALQRQAEARGQNCNGVWLRRMARAVTPYVEEVWPFLKADEVLAEYLSDPSQAGVLTADEQRAIAWPRPRKAKTARWTATDAVLLDEVSALLERSPTYGHVIVDDAQDLSPMQCRAIARRSEHTSITVLGDLAQGTTAWAANDWPTQLTHLGLGQPGKATAEIVALSTGYRVPATVVELANRLLTALDVAVPPTTSFRSDGELTITRVDDLAVACVENIRRALSVEGSIGVIAADHQLPAVSDALKAAGIETSAADGDGRVAVVPASLAKGLEYDHVIALEPAEIVASETRGLNRLYVVLTRAVSRLDILHSRELPPELGR
ncbi:HelD family protein [Kribbella soli]|uniref:AAA family ATPase n=1 Tax=Kribbella soli TaxID=1124743 RepID=A0A4R0HB45_9ACTN|nr:AAA family ATPase [Kribbella soli]TCC08187.1 AAA family ATPase [Kribbella soli]